MFCWCSLTPFYVSFGVRWCLFVGFYWFSLAPLYCIFLVFIGTFFLCLIGFHWHFFAHQCFKYFSNPCCSSRFPSYVILMFVRFVDWYFPPTFFFTCVQMWNVQKQFKLHNFFNFFMNNVVFVFLVLFLSVFFHFFILLFFFVIVLVLFQMCVFNYVKKNQLNMF